MELLALAQRGHRALGDLVHLAEGRDRDDQVLRLVVVDDRLGLRVVDLQPLADGLLAVVLALVEVAAADVADASVFGLW